MRPRHERKELGLWLLVAALAVLTWVLLPRIPQPLQYHDFADQRACFGVANCFDTASNLFFVLAGLLGLHFLFSKAGRGVFINERESLPYFLFFFAAILVGIGSGYYHLAPDNYRLLWDRAAISLALMSLLAAFLCERVSLSAGLRLLPLLLVAGLGSVAYWGWSETHGIGDLRAYILMQLYPMLLIPLLHILYLPRYSKDRGILAIIGLYLLALLCDFADHQIAALTGVISGHTAKHIVAALAIYLVVVRLRRRIL